MTKAPLSLRMGLDRSTLALAMIVGSSFAAPRSARAQSAPSISESAMVTRRALVERAQSAARANNHSEALALAEQAGRIEMSPSLRLFIAQERAALGRHASAMEYAELCVREASRNEALERREMILAACRQVLTTSQRNVVLLALSVPSARRTGFSLRVGGRLLADGDLNVPVALDPGEHALEATAPGVETHRETIRGTPGAMLSATIPERFAASAAEPTTQSSNTQSAGNGADPARATMNNTGATQGNSSGTPSGQRSDATPAGGAVQTPVVPRQPTTTPGFVARVGAGPFVTLGVGAGLVATSIALSVVAQNAFNGTGCRPAGAEILCQTAQQAEAFRAGGPGAPDPYTPTTIAQVSLGLGLGAIVGATIWMAAAGARGESAPREQRAQRVWFAPVASRQAASLVVGGAL
jgi:hypothetical protein